MMKTRIKARISANKDRTTFGIHLENLNAKQMDAFRILIVDSIRQSEELATLQVDGLGLDSVIELIGKEQ